VNDPDRRRPPEGFDEDAIFADIVAHLNDDADETEPAARPSDGDAAPDAVTTEEPAKDSTTESKAETNEEDPNLPPAGGPRSGPNPWPFTSPPGMATHEDPPADPAPQAWRAHEVDDDYEEHFEPPPVRPLPAGDLQFWGIIAGMCGGPLLLLYLVLFNRDASSWWIFAAIALAVGGFALLVSRIPGHQGDDDDGARL
jgi:hypothetical protein